MKPLNDDQNLELLEFFKALADPSRLKILCLLANQSMTVEQLSEALDLRASTISHHLGYLRHVGLVSASAQGWYNHYRLESDTLQQMTRRLLEPGHLGYLTAPEPALPNWERQVLADFLRPDGSLREIPARRKKRQVILQHLRQAFQVGQRYSEAEVNRMLEAFHPDTATLRRELVGEGLMARQGGGEYWRVEETK